MGPHLVNGTPVGKSAKSRRTSRTRDATTGATQRATRELASSPAAGTTSTDTPALDVPAQKEVEYYAALVNGWIATRMELDRTLVALSAGGLGLFVTLLTTVGVRSRAEVCFYSVGTAGFVATIGVGLWIFLQNATFFEQIMKGEGKNGDPVLVRLDRALVVLFAIGALCAMLTGASAAIAKHQQEQHQEQHDEKQRTIQEMPSMNKPNTPAKTTTGSETQNAPAGTHPTPPDAGSQWHPLNESVNGFQKLRADTDFKKGSIDGFQKLRPSARVSPAASTPTHQPSDPTPGATSGTGSNATPTPKPQPGLRPATAPRES